MSDVERAAPELFPHRGGWRHAGWCDWERLAEPPDCTCGLDAARRLLAARPDEPPAWLSVDRLAAAMNDAQVQASEIRLGHDLRIPAARILSRLRTPDAPADGGGSLDAERLARAMHVALGKHTDHTGPVCPACREDATDAAREYLRLTPSVPTDREPT